MFRVYLTGWKGMKIEEATEDWGRAFKTEEEAMEYINRAYEEELEPDELAYIFHNGVLREA